MRTTRGWTGLRSLAFALAIACGAASSVSASQMTINYSSTGSVATTGVSGPSVINYNSVSNGSFTTPSAFSLGEFLVAALPAGTSTTFTNTPFNVNFTITQSDGTKTPVNLSGVLNGTITGPDQSSVVATFNPIANPDISIGGGSPASLELSVLSPTVSLVPSTTNGGRSTVQAHLVSQIAPVPEPAALAVIVSGLAALGLRRRLRPRG
jgi:hypothetical protein